LALFGVEDIFRRFRTAPRRVVRADSVWNSGSTAYPVWSIPRVASWAALIALYGIALAGIAFANVPHAALSLVPGAYFVAVLANFATAAVLFVGTNAAAPRRSSFALALTFATVGIFTLFAMLVLPLLPGTPPIWPRGAQAGAWLYVLWHAVAGAGALVYASLRNGPRTERRVSTAFAARGAGLTCVVIVVGLALALWFVDLLPHIVVGTSIVGLRTTGAGFVLLLVCGSAAVATFRIPKPTEVDRALTLTLLALTAEVTIYLIAPQRYATSFYVARFLQLAATTFVLASATRALAGLTKKLDEAEVALTRVESESMKRADRIQALWRIAATDAIFDDRSRYQEILRIATGAIRGNKPMFGLLCHLEQTTIVIDATSGVGPPGAAGTVYPGARYPLENTIQSVLLATGRTQAWDDLAEEPRSRQTVVRDFGWRSLIGAPLKIGRSTHFVLFASRERMTDEPYDDDDVAYVDLVASFLSSRFEQQQQVERLQFQSRHDALTGLETRLQFRDALRQEVTSGRPFAIAMADIDDFRHLNEVEGHEIGDEVLVEIGATLRGVDDRDLVARLSGDQFGILLRGTGNEGSVTAAMDRYMQRFRTPFETADRDGTRAFDVTASFGVAPAYDGGVSADDLMRRAAVALDVAKSRGAATLMLFDAPMEAILQERLVRSTDLSAAISENQLALVYQPTFDLATRTITGAEALVRWDHPTRGRLPPSEFIPFAERSGLMSALSRWVFERVVRDVLSTELPADFICYFNIAPQLLSDFSFIETIRQTLRANPGLSTKLGMELTETAAMQNVERSMHTLTLFRSWGLRVAIDDFGTGYSSLSYLKRLAVDLIKIDKSFVDGLPGDDKDAALCEMLLRMAERFGLATLAEGIETERQATWLLQHGCTSGQGFLVSRPVEFFDLLISLHDRAIVV
jgi:diguanylate cyclase (GGDEF)-like protein